MDIPHCSGVNLSNTIVKVSVFATSLNVPFFSKLQELMAIPDYMSKQTDINASMRTILIDWLVEVQENFELFHETLYIAVRLVDTYLSRKEVKREYLQLVGATCMLVAAKFEVREDPFSSLSRSLSCTLHRIY